MGFRVRSTILYLRIVISFTVSTKEIWAAQQSPSIRRMAVMCMTFITEISKRLGWLSCSYRSRHGLIRSDWKLQGDPWRYEIETPVDAVITIAGQISLFWFYALR